MLKGQLRLNSLETNTFRETDSLFANQETAPLFAIEPTFACKQRPAKISSSEREQVTVKPFLSC